MGGLGLKKKMLTEGMREIDIHDGVLFGPTPEAPVRTKVYEGSCHCGNIRWTAKLRNAEHILCHCDTCKKLGGGPYSLNAIIARSDLNITRGEPKDYTYTGASGISSLAFLLLFFLWRILTEHRQTSPLLPLWELYKPCLSPPRSDGGEYYSEDDFAGWGEGDECWWRDLW